MWLGVLPFAHHTYMGMLTVRIITASTVNISRRMTWGVMCDCVDAADVAKELALTPRYTAREIQLSTRFSSNVYSPLSHVQ